MKFKKGIPPVEEWISWCDVDGGKTLYQFTDSDIPVLRDAIRKQFEMHTREVLWKFVNKYAFAPDIKEQMFDELFKELNKI